MKIIDLNLPDLSDHPPAPQLTFEQFEAWVCREIGPALAQLGESTPEKLREHFLRNEGRMGEFRYDG